MREGWGSLKCPGALSASNASEAEKAALTNLRELKWNVLPNRHLRPAAHQL
jgi:hypothetical protein